MTRDLDDAAYSESLEEPLDARAIEPTVGSYLEAFFDRQRRDPSRFEDWPTNEQMEHFKRGGR